MFRRLRREWRRGQSADPRLHSPLISEARRESLAFAIAGCAYMLRHQKNTRIMLVASATVIALGAWLEIDWRDWAMLALANGLVWFGEFINAAIEATVNLSAPQIHPLARLAKDVAAAAVLLAALVAALVGMLILLPPLLDRLA
ncbi:MAG: diacylglycerol kinase family protein [Chloroflexi bacterium]|nr:diacylglycerol kinase family protein [Chloroflexota bacterium]MDE2651492.1 diacylglycerol kinase family protein [Chloroflexota bacterium]MXV94238.1 diacylglycerol kinase family protein [Chloroflexota bacterium]MXX52040.1 diacylglycerol kinase family protein [Chloroflexota bacterium]MYE79911.1 diacylglycerol kinase family protein [Chloroflexota bacterium]